ncbi:PfkB family carbohydrate kinase [Mycobacterium angelicum]|uniref:Ribokinase n=1 Tax=Mycobacterium angelicum TaxID=470074 RepID=A0A1W9ZP09_MYCAN|nr:PfkB family carbohydrate kinase [Mycobacterium angelicum]MCV7198779.1 bifunctional hydroxymethylpyrimidine kinase/phosphomethylpyrimidine kinase [Mycobacterium angelicum]ORA19363.1 ribokinase [Mycobacterium angelicum]
MGVVVIGQIGRDLVLRTDGAPTAGSSSTVLQRQECLGGKGANQAVGLAQLGAPVALIGVVGDDAVGASILGQAAQDGIDIEGVVRRGTTALLIDVIGPPPNRILLEAIPEPSLVQVADVGRSAALFDRADTVSIQLQQPAATVLDAARRAKRSGALVVADGAPEQRSQAALLALVDVLRADAAEAALIAGHDVASMEAAKELGDRILADGPRMVALAIPDVGDLLVWNGGSRLFEFADVDVVDRTGAGDAFVAGLIAALRTGAQPEQAGECAAAAASCTVQHLGGRPDLSELSRRR